MPSKQTADVVIIGGGLAGIATAYYLTRDGVSCTVVERDYVASHASGFAYGGIGHLGRTGSPGPNHHVAALSARLHTELKDTLPGETGIDVEYRNKPVISLAFTDEEAYEARLNMDWQQRELRTPTRWADIEEAIEIEPRVNPAAIGAVVTEGNTNLHPQRLAFAMAQMAESRGATIRYGAVTGLHRDGDKVSGVILNDGEIATDRVVLATGPWMGQTSEWLGVRIPVEPLKGQILRLRVLGPPIAASVGWGSQYATSKPDGMLWTGATEEEVGFDETPTESARTEVMDAVVKMLPYTADARLVLQTACLRPMTPDKALLLGTVPGWEGVYLATGGARQGIFLGPGIGRVTADLVQGNEPSASIDGLTLARFQ
jgi:glycine oxidase